MSYRPDPEEQYSIVRAGIVAIKTCAGIAGGENVPPEDLAPGGAFWAEGADGERALEDLIDLAHYLAEEHGVGTTFCAYCSDPVEDPEEAANEAHDECRKAE